MTTRTCKLMDGRILPYDMCVNCIEDNNGEWIKPSSKRVFIGVGVIWKIDGVLQRIMTDTTDVKNLYYFYQFVNEEKPKPVKAMARVLNVKYDTKKATSEHWDAFIMSDMVGKYITVEKVYDEWWRDIESGYRFHESWLDFATVTKKLTF